MDEWWRFWRDGLASGGLYGYSGCLVVDNSYPLFRCQGVSFSCRFCLDGVEARKVDFDGVVEREGEARRRAVVTVDVRGGGKRRFVGVVVARSRASKRCKIVRVSFSCVTIMMVVCTCSEERLASRDAILARRLMMSVEVV